MSDERELIIYLIRILFSNASHAERMEEQQENINMMKHAIELNPVLSAEERNLLSLAYKNAVTSRRNALREIRQQIENYSQHEMMGSRLEKLKALQETLQKELEEIAMDLVVLIDDSLLPTTTSPDVRLFYEKMKGDYYRYICEQCSPELKDDYANKAKECYDTALEIAKSELPPASPLFLGLVLNYSVFMYEILGLQNEAIELSSRTFQESVDMIDSMDEDTYAETTMILHLLRDNHTKWIQTRDSG